jgi:DNA-directed RNA polymerase specialized sigma24 family protein
MVPAFEIVRKSATVYIDRTRLHFEDEEAHKMNDESDTWSNKYDSWSAKKSDEQLAEVLRGDNRDDIEIATLLLRDRYQTKLIGYVGKKLPYDWVEDITQDIWAAFYNYVRVEGVRKGVSNLLWRIARNKRADAVERRRCEINIESDIPLAEYIDDVRIGGVEPFAEELLEERERRQQVHQLPLIPVLSDCQALVFMMRGLQRTP